MLHITQSETMSRSSQVSLSLAQAERQPLVVAHVVEHCIGGVGSAVRNLIDAQALDEGVAAIHLFTDFRRMGDMLHGAPAIVHPYTSSRRPHQLPKVARLLREELRRLNPDVVYLHSTFPGLYGRMGKKAEGDKWATIYCAHGWAFTQKLSLPAKTIYTLVERMLAPRADALVSISHSEFDAALKGKVQARLNRVIYHGMPGSNAQLAAPTPIAVDPARINLGFIGRFDYQKGLDLLLEAFKDPRLQHVDLYLIGESTLGRTYDIPSQPNIKKLGWVKNAEIDAYIRCFDAVVIPSRWEGFGLIALEAMRNGKPVLASRIGGLAELVVDRANGRLIRPDDVSDLRRILLELNKEDLQRMGQAASSIFSSAFQIRDCYTQWSSLTEETLGSRRQTSSAGLSTKSDEVPAKLFWKET
jgi:glycosyltransferase involved in cell wall biosynthesis